MDLISLYYFQELSKDLNMTRTAQRLYISQQTLSNHIHRLEQHYGCPLLYRKPTLSLTCAGEFVLSFAQVVRKEERNLEDYRKAKMGIPKTELEGKTLGLVGLGNIGKLVAKKAALGFDMTVLAYDPFAKKEGLPEYIQLVEDRDEIFKQSDYVSLHVPATPETVHSISDREFDLMKDTAYLINAARGSIVDEPALIRALEAGKIAGAGLDTLEKEPIDPSNPLVSMDNVLTAPHIGGATKEASSRSSVACAQAIDDYFSGRTPKFVVPELRDLLNK